MRVLVWLTGLVAVTAITTAVSFKVRAWLVRRNDPDG